MEREAPAIGIDLGTTYSRVAICHNGKVEVIANDQGSKAIPSYVAFTNAERLVGEAAMNQAATNPENTIFDVKRLIGRRYEDPTVQEDLKDWPFLLIKYEEKAKIQVEYKGETQTFYPEQISAMLLEKLKETAESYLRQMVTDAVIAVPCNFNDAQRNSTMVAARIAGLKVLKILNAPAAAALSYRNQTKFSEKRHVVVFNLGAGTVDVSVLCIKNGVLKVKAAAGDTHLGGKDFDNSMVKYLADEFKRKYNRDLTGSNSALLRLRAACEEAKKKLSSEEEATIEEERLFEDIDFHTSISRSRFEILNIDLFYKCLEPMKRAFNDSRLNRSDIDDVIFVGGSTRIPKIQAFVHDFFYRKRFGKYVIPSLSLSCLNSIDKFNIKTSINPDEAVACGAAIQAAVLKGDKSDEVKDLVLADVTPLSLGICIHRGSPRYLMSVIIKRNSRIPTKKTERYTTIYDNQSAVSIKIYEGERKFVKDNFLLGSFELTGIPPAPAGVPKIGVTLDRDINGILNVRAVEMSTGKTKSIAIKHDMGRLSQEEVERLVKEAEKYREKDEKNMQNHKTYRSYYSVSQAKGN